MDEQDLSRLEALAGKATPGPWVMLAGESPADDWDAVRWPIAEEADVSRPLVAEVFTAETQAFIAAANPETVRALIAEVRSLRAEKARLRAAVVACDEDAQAAEAESRLWVSRSKVEDGISEAWEEEWRTGAIEPSAAPAEPPAEPEP